MSTQFKLLKTKRFLPIFIAQYTGAFNDNLFKQCLVLIVTAAAVSSELTTLSNLAAILFILPYFIFSSTAGQLADKFENAQLTQYLKIAEISIMLLATVGFYIHNIPLLMLCLFLMGAHSTFFGPIKYSILPKLLKKEELVGGNAMFEMGTSMAILTGLIAAGFIVSQSHEDPFWMSAAVLAVAVIGYIAARSIPICSINQSSITIDWNLIRTTKQTVSFAFSHRPVFYSILGIAWFWYYGATFLTQLPQFTKEILNGTDEVVTLLLTLFSVGIAIGALLCERITKHQINLKLVAVGAGGVALFAMDFYFALHFFTASTEKQGVMDMLTQSSNYRILLDLVCVGTFSGIYLVQLYAFMQEKSPISHRARIIAANNIFSALFMVASSVISMIHLQVFKFSLPTLFLLTAIIGVGVSIIAVHKIRQFQVE